MIESKSFIKALKSLKIKKNSSCLLHTSIINLGCFEDNKIDNIPNNIFRLLKKIIGKNGTISVLGSNYDVISKKKKF